MKNRLEIKGKERLSNVIVALIESGYTVLVHEVEPEQLAKPEEERYVVVEYSLTKYGDPTFKLEEE